MDKINYSDIDLSRLDKYSVGLYKNDFFINERDSIYKIYKTRDKDILKRRDCVLDLYEELGNKYIINASSKIVDDDLTIGYISRYVDGETLTNLIRKKGILSELKTIIELSKRLENIHNSENEPIIGDMHFNNVVVENNNPFFIDHDSYGIKEIKPESVSGELYLYCKKKGYKIDYSKDSDKLSLLLTFLYKTLGRNFIDMNGFLFEDYYYQYPFLLDMKELYKDIIKDHKEMPKVPYLHYVIKE